MKFSTLLGVVSLVISVAGQAWFLAFYSSDDPLPRWWNSVGFFGAVFLTAIGCAAVARKHVLGKTAFGLGVFSFLVTTFLLLASQ